MTTSYDDIIDLPHHVSPTRRRMSAYERAAQFAPFAALTGYDAAIGETARLTQAEPETDEERIRELDGKLRILNQKLSERPEVTVVFFVPDDRKAGGSFEKKSGVLRTISAREQSIGLEDGTEIAMEWIMSLESEVFKERVAE
ncbi:MAG: hypothetical protein MJ118_07180 [Clostridia bacterium]|nr:hypothetical protein [Clostridia bacterium]